MRDTRLRIARARTVAPVWNVQPLQQHFAKDDGDDGKGGNDPDPDPDDDKGKGGNDPDPDDGDGKGKGSDDDKGKGGKSDDEPDYRKIARDNDNKAKAAERRLRNVLKAAGIETDDDDDVDSLKGKLEQRDKRNRETLIENAVLRATPRGVDVDDLTDSRSFMRSLDDLDPEDAGFAAEVAKLVKAEVKRRGLDDDDDDGDTKRRRKGGVPGKDEQDDKSQLTRAELSKMTPQQINKARVDGRLRDIMAGKG